jgi:hypothetical protein
VGAEHAAVNLLMGLLDSDAQRHYDHTMPLAAHFHMPVLRVCGAVCMH